MQSPKVSIILPVYKNRDTLQGLYSQLSNISSPEIEFVFVDDACPENSLEFLKELVAIAIPSPIMAKQAAVWQSEWN